MPSTDNPGRMRRVKWTAALLSVIVAIGACEAMLRFTLFHAPGAFASQRPEYYARSLDEFWIYTQIFSASRRWSVGATTPDTSGETRIEFYKGWPISLTPDRELGYVRKAGVHTPCHETTNLATRGTHYYAPTGRKIVFFGDSFVESAACSDETLAAKLEALTGIDTLNYGIGGYGLDQIYLYFKRELPRFDRRESLFLIGLIQDDLARVLLRVRTSPKPYFTISGDRLVLHTDHIHPESLGDAFERPPERFYLYYFLRGRFGEPVYRSLLRETRNERQQAAAAVTRLLLKALADLGQQEPFRLAFVIFPTPGAPFDSAALSTMRAQGLQVIDLQGCLLRSNLPDRELYAELHPTSLGNDLLARCLVQDLAAKGLLPSP
jgi:hypothetical protein